MKNFYPQLALAVISFFTLFTVDVNAQCTARALPFTENFSGTPLGTCTPTTGGWVGSSAASGAGWWRPNTNWAQGTAAPEIEAQGDQANAGAVETITLQSPPLNAASSSLIVTFKHNLYATNYGTSGTGNGTLKLQSSPDGTTWTDRWTQSYNIPGSGSGITSITRAAITVPTFNSGGNTAYIRFSITGVMFKVWGWEIDDVVVSSPAPAPAITSFTPNDACAGSGVFVTITGTNFTGATAVAFNGVAAQTFTVDNATQITATLPAGATTGVITVTTPGGTATSATSFTVSPIPVATATPASQTVCSGDNVSIALSSNVNGTTYAWSRTNPVEINAASSMPLNDSGNPSGTMHSDVTTPVAVVFTIIPTANGCGGDEVTATVIVSSAPAQPGNITGDDSVCNGGVYSYSIAAVSGATSYTWTLPSGWAGTSSTESINVTASNTVGNVSVTANNNCGSSAAQTFAVGAGIAPAQPGAISGPDSFCTGGSYTYTISPVATATSYTWVLPNGWSGTSNTTSITVIAGASAGSISVSADNGCGSSNLQSLVINAGSAPATPGAITGPDSICNGESHTYSIVPVSGATSYTWVLPNGWTGTSTTESISVVTGAAGGVITVTADNACGSSSAQTFTVNTSLPPATPGLIVGIDTACSGTTNTFSVAAVSGATSYTWTLPGGWVGTSTTESISATLGTATGTISVTADNGCGASTAQTKDVTILNVTGAPILIDGPDSVCSGASVTYSVPASSGGDSYNWTLPNGWTGTSTTLSITATAGSQGGVITVSSNSACGTSTDQTKTVTITTTAPQPAAITGPDSICSGGTATFSVTPAAGATSYTWTLPQGWSGTSTTESINVTASASAGAISVTATGACGTSADQNKIVFITTGAPVLTAISGPDSVCPNSPNTFSVSPVNGATYTWTLPQGWIGTSTTESINVTASASAGVVSVTATGGCGTSQAQTKTITIATAPNVPGVVTGPAGVCANSTNTYSITAVSGATSYTWTLPPGWTGSSTTTTISATANATAGTIEVTATGACGTSASRTKLVSIDVAPAIPGAINGPDSVCSGGSATYSITAVNGATSYTWTLPSGWSGTSTTASINAVAGVGAGVVSVTANSGCGSSVAQTKTVTITATTAAPASITGPDSLCSGATATFSVTSVTGATSYTWTLPNGWTGTSATTTISAVAGTGGGAITITATGCGTSAPATKNVTVNALPQLNFTISQSPVCSNASPVTLVATPAGGTFTGIGVTSGAFNPAVAGNGTHSITYAYTDANGCSASATATVTVNTCTDIIDVTKNDIYVYPNPFSDNLMVQFGSGEVNAQLKLFDLTGKLIMTMPADNSTGVNIGTAQLQKGVYMLQVIINHKIKRIEKLMKL